jgi:hypothetical protein
MFHDILPLDTYAKKTPLDTLRPEQFGFDLSHYTTEKQEEVHSALRLTKRQVNRIFEALTYIVFGFRWSEEFEKQFRLHVKRRLFKEDPQLQDCANKKQILHEMYEDEVECFHTAGQHLRRLIREPSPF